MTTGRINQVCQMLLLTALFHGSMDERSQTAARNSKLFTTQGTAPEHTFKALLSKRNSLLDARHEDTCADKSDVAGTSRQLEHGKPCFAKSHCTQRVVMTTKSHSAGSAMEPPLYQRTRPPPEAREYELKWVSRSDAG